MTDRHAIVWNIAGQFENIQPGDIFRVNEDAHFVGNIAVDGTVDGQDLAAMGTKVDFLSVTGAINLDPIKTKTDWLTVTQAVDLDALEARITALSASVVLKGTWDASIGSYPVSTVAGESWICNFPGTVDTVVYVSGDRIIALIDGASTVSRLDWHLERYTDQVTDVNGKIGSVTLVEADISDLQAYTLPVDFDSLSKLNALCGESLMTTEQLDTLAELNALVGDTDVLGANGSVPTVYQDFTPGASPAHTEGRVFYDNVAKTLCYYTDDVNVTNNLGEEMWIRVINNSGVVIPDGTPVSIDGAASGLPQVIKAAHNSHTIGVITTPLANGAEGYITTIGIINNLNLSAFAVGDELFVDPITPGALTATKPVWPYNITEIGHVLDNSAITGRLLVDIENNGNSNLLTKAYTFSARNAASGVYYVGGSYTAPAADANLTQAAATVNLGSANHPYSAHAFMVFGAASTDGSNITLTVTGTSITDAGVRTPADSQVLYTGPVAGLTLNDYLETSKKWLGIVTYTLTSDGVNFTCDFNYGFAKYEDFSNLDHTLIGFEVTGLCNVADPGFEVEVLHHKETDWTYSTTAFIPGPIPVAKLTTDLATDSDLATDGQFAWKRANLAEAINGAGEEGTLIRITTSVNNSISYLNANIMVQV